MRRFAALALFLLLTFSTVHIPRASAADDSQKPRCEVKVVDKNDATTLQLNLSSCTSKAEPKAQAATAQTSSESTFSYRVGNHPWVTLKTENQQLTIRGLTYLDRLVLVGAGDCKSPPKPSSNDQPESSSTCSPRALMVQTAPKPENEKEEVRPAWHQLLSWDPDGKHYRIVDPLDDFFKPDLDIRIVINGTTIVEELKPQADDSQDKSQHKSQDRSQEKASRLEMMKKKQNRSWAGKPLDPEADIWIGIYSAPKGCRDFLPSDSEAKLDEIDIPATHKLVKGPENGITLGSPKIFDSFALRQKLAVTSSQLASMNAFSQAQITAQYGSFQGITRDTSYVAAQATTSPTPSIVSTAAGLASSAVNTSSPSNQSTVNVQATCPAGYYPAFPANGAVTCTAGTSTNALSGSQLTTTSNPATNQTVTTIAQPTAQTQTTTPSLQGTVPTAPTLNPLTPPSNVGVSAADMLTEQTELSSELTTLQMLLQGASSDQLLLSHQRAFGVRAQTTIGFPISVETPTRLKGAVAEVRVLVLPRNSGPTSQPISIVNLLPSEKTYNVARVTSKAHSFGFGVATQPISFGLNTGKSKDRLYLAKDADTIALQYPPGGYSGPPDDRFQGDDETTPGECGEVPPDVSDIAASNPKAYDFTSAVMFGWQFRPVLGASSVAAGRRTVFAQLALPQQEGINFEPEVWIQTRWRYYDQKNQLAGRVHDDSCHWKKIDDPLAFSNPVVIKNVQVTDVGQGLLRFHATGDFFSSTGQMRSGSLNVAPQFFDGYSLEYFAAAKDVLSNGDLELLDEAMHPQSLVIKTRASSCRISDAKLSAIPMADGNSLMQLEYDRSIYKPDVNNDGPQHPLVLIGTDVYGLRDKPLRAADPHHPQELLDADSACKPSRTKAHCTFTFVASTDSIRSARNFLVRDPAWDNQGVTGPIAIDPTFTKIEASAKPAKSDDSSDSRASAKPKEDPKPSWFLLSGTDLSLIKRAAFVDTVVPAASPEKTSHPEKPEQTPGRRHSGTTAETQSPAEKPKIPDPPNLPSAPDCTNDHGCIQIVADGSDGSPITFTHDQIRVASDTSAWLWLTHPVGVHIFWSRKGRSASEWDLAIKEDKGGAITADPAVLYETDSRAVTFSGADFSNVKQVFFEGKPLDLVAPATKSKLIVQVTSAVTAKFGHKELITQVPDDKDKSKVKTIALPLDVVRH